MKLFAALALALVLVASCAEPPERTPATCVGCGVRTGGGVGLPNTGGSAGTGQGMAGAGAEANEPVSLTGNVILLDDFAFETGPLFVDPATIRVEGQSGASVTGDWDGLASYQIDGVERGAEVWVLATPRPTSVALPTLGPLDTTEPNTEDTVTADLVVIGRDVIDTILDLLTVPTERDESRAMVLMRVTDDRGAPLSGATVIAQSAEVVIYGDGGTFSDAATVTDSSGLVLLANVPSGSWPGNLVGVTFAGALEGGIDVRAVTGAVTFERVAP